MLKHSVRSRGSAPPLNYLCRPTEWGAGEIECYTDSTADSLTWRGTEQAEGQKELPVTEELLLGICHEGGGGQRWRSASVRFEVNIGARIAQWGFKFESEASCHTLQPGHLPSTKPFTFLLTWFRYGMDVNPFSVGMDALLDRMLVLQDPSDSVCWHRHALIIMGWGIAHH